MFLSTPIFSYSLVIRCSEKADIERERYAVEMSQFRYQQAEIDAERRFQNFEARLVSLWPYLYPYRFLDFYCDRYKLHAF